MSLVISDPATLAAMASAKDGTEIRDPNGRFVGFFQLPVGAESELGLTLDELDRRCNLPASEYVSGEEVMARLQAIRDQS